MTFMHRPDNVKTMLIHFFAPSIALLAAAQTFTNQAPVPPSEIPLTLEQRGDIRCAAAFAIVALEQQRGVASALAYPNMEPRGRTFFGQVGSNLVAETGRPREEIRAVLVAEFTAFQQAAAANNDPDATIDAIMPACLIRLDAEVPPPPAPSLPQCAAILALAYDEVYAREGLSSTAKDLKTLATVLDNRARGQLREKGQSGSEIDVILGTLKAQLASEAEALAEQGKSPNLDYEYCFELAEP